jgi:hypothetical protein
LSVVAPEICVAHLVRRSNEVSAFRTFMDSYRRHDPGVCHDLLIIFKGYRAQANLSIYDAILEGVPHQRIFLPDVGFDVRPYVEVARKQPHPYLVLFNSFSRILVPGWLQILFRGIRRPGVGLVGATGSHQSVYSDFHVLQSEMRRARPLMHRLTVGPLRYARYLTSIRGRFPALPNYHVRTNAFIVQRDILASMQCGVMLRKWSAYRFESGIGSLTNRVLEAGLRPLVAGADGGEYEAPDWPDSHTFWIGKQENLLVADNQTRAYDEGTAAMRDRLAYYAWRRRPDGTPRPDYPSSNHA